MRGGTEAEDGLAFLHHVESVACYRFKIFAVGLQKMNFQFTFLGEFLEILKLCLLLGQMVLHLVQTEPFRIEGESGGEECGADDQNPDGTHRRRQKI